MRVRVHCVARALMSCAPLAPRARAHVVAMLSLARVTPPRPEVGHDVSGDVGGRQTMHRCVAARPPAPLVGARVVLRACVRARALGTLPQHTAAQRHVVPCRG